MFNNDIKTKLGLFIAWCMPNWLKNNWKWIVFWKISVMISFFFGRISL